MIEAIVKLLIALLSICLVFISVSGNKKDRSGQIGAGNLDVLNKTQDFAQDQGQQEADALVIANNLYVPWSIAVIPNSNRILVTERDGGLTEIDSNNKNRTEVPGVMETGEGGLLGLALHPEFLRNNLIYLYYTTPTRVNRVVRYIYLGPNNLLFDRVIIDDIPGGSIHNGGFLIFEPGTTNLLITTGDAGDKDSAQDLDSLSGKILRLTEDGDISSDNPFGSDNPIYSYGHRNPQGLTFDRSGNLWAIDHGPSGMDELNRIVPGGNYGWPLAQGDQRVQGTISPVLHSGTDRTWAPGGILYVNQRLYFTGLRGERLYFVQLNQNNLGRVRETSIRQGRLRAIAKGPDNSLYVSTSNRDGRGRVRQGDDKILRIVI